MGLKFEAAMTIPEILDGTKKTITANINLLAEIYTEKTGREVCRTCPSDVQYMILSLKNIYNMTQFKFKGHAKMYKFIKGGKETISNGTMTDERAIKFLEGNPDRISLFSEFPSNWETLLFSDTKKETKKAKEKRLAAEAELKAAKAAEDAAKDLAAGKNENKDLTDESNLTGSKDSEKLESDAVKEATKAAEKAATDAMKPSRQDLEKFSLKELRAKYPAIKATSIKLFIDKVLA